MNVNILQDKVFGMEAASFARALDRAHRNNEGSYFIHTTHTHIHFESITVTDIRF